MRLCRGSKVLVAANLHDSGALMPHYTLQLLALLAALPRGSAFLSVYESGSTDDTGARAPLAPTLPTRVWDSAAWAFGWEVTANVTRSENRRILMLVIAARILLCHLDWHVKCTLQLPQCNCVRGCVQGCGWRSWRRWWRRSARRTAWSRTAA